jgi:hypothetical protein
MRWGPKGCQESRLKPGYIVAEGGPANISGCMENTLCSNLQGDSERIAKKAVFHILMGESTDGSRFATAYDRVRLAQAIAPI